MIESCNKVTIVSSLKKSFLFNAESETKKKNNHSEAVKLREKIAIGGLFNSFEVLEFSWTVSNFLWYFRFSL